MTMEVVDGSGKSEERLILGAQLRKAREMVQFNPEEVAERLGIRQEGVLEWEAERTRPSLRQLERLAEIYGREIDYFLRETPGVPARIQLRSATRRSFEELSEEARVVIAKFDELCRAAFELERMLGKTQPPLQRVSKKLSPTKLAWQQRNSLGFGEKPIGKLRDRLTQEGIRVFELPVPPGQFSGFSYWHQVYGPCILINADESSGRRNFTLAHEYAHLLYGHAPSVCDISDEGRPGPAAEERLADLFTIEFLLPAEPVREYLLKLGFPTRPSMQEVGKIAGRWYVSVQAILYRLEELRLVEQGYARDLLASEPPPPPFRRRSKRSGWRRRLGETFVSDALEAYHKGHVSLGTLARNLGLPLRKALEVAESSKKTR